MTINPVAAADAPAARRSGKSAQAFRTISEVAQELDVPQHVLRFWETKFPQIKPLKRGGGRRYYRPEDVELLRGIHKLLHQDGYTIKGAQKLLRESGRPGVQKAGGRAASLALAPGEVDLADDGGGEELDLFADPAGGLGDDDDFVPFLPVLSSEKRALLRTVLAELEELRALIPRTGLRLS